MTHTFYNRGGVLTLRINLGEHNKRKVKSLGIPIGDLEVTNNKVEGLSKVALKANAKINRVEVALAEGRDIDEAISQELYKPADTETSFAELMDAAKLGKDKKVYGPVVNRYKEYAEGEDFIIEKVNLQTIHRNIDREKAIREMDEHWEGFINYLADRGLSNSSISTYLAVVSAVVSYARRYKGVEIPFNASVKVIDTKPYTWPVSVTEGFLSSEQRGPVMDACKIMIYTCMRPGDALKLRKEHFKQEGEVFYVEKINRKTQKITESPIPEEAWHELKECRWIGLSLRAFRYNLSKVLEPFDRPATIYEQKGNKIVKIETTLVEATSPKTFRKIGVNRLADKGVDETVIRDFYTGHATAGVFRRFYRNQELKKVL